MKDFKFKKHQLSENEKIWLTELLSNNFNKVEAKSVKVKLWDKISNEFDPSKIDYRLVRENRLTLLGLWYIDPRHRLIEMAAKIIDETRKIIVDNPHLLSVESNNIARRLKLDENDIKIMFSFMFDLGLCNGGAILPNENLFSTISFNNEPTAFDKILSFKNTDDILENHYLQFDHSSRKEKLDVIYPIKTIVKKQSEKTKLKKLIARLYGIREVVLKDPYVRKELGDDFNKAVKQLSEALDEDLSDFFLEDNFWHLNPFNEKYCNSDKIINKLSQAISYLENELNSNQNKDEISILFNSIIDKELRSRCADILVAQSHYDRVINQSTLVLEDRIRKKANAERNLVGVQLVNKVLNTVISKSVLKLSSNPEEHEGISQICRGIMIGFRNPTHHHLTEKYIQTEALKFCCFIDNILQIIDNAEINTPALKSEE